MKSAWSGLLVAFSLYSAVPVPQVRWEKRTMRWALSFFICSVTWPYTSRVNAAVWCPRLPWTVLISSPARREATAKVWRRS